MNSVDDLKFVTPESEGLSSREFISLIDYIERLKLNIHSFMLVRHGNVLGEAYAKPFDASFNHRIYSCSKTYVAFAILKLVDEGKLSLSDKIVDYFPEYKDKCHPFLKETTIENLLTMTVPLQRDSYISKNGKTAFIENDWIGSFFSPAQKIVKYPGSIFNYNTSGTYVLCVLIERLTGKTFLEVLRPIFDEIGVASDIECIKSPDGHAWGGSGVLTTMRDFAKMGELLLHKGNHKGKQLISRELMERMTSPLVDNIYDNNFTYINNGYGYQVWMEPEGYGLHGLGWQYAFCFPKKDFMFVCNADEQCSGQYPSDILYNRVRELYETLGEGKEDDPKAQEELSRRLASYALPQGYGEKHSPIEKEVSGITYFAENEDAAFKWFRFVFEKEEGILEYERGGETKKIRFGYERHIEFPFPEKHYYDMQIERPGNRELRAIASAAWRKDNRLLLRINIIDHSFGHLGIVTEFLEGGRAMMRLVKSAEELLGEYQGYIIGKAR